MPEFRWVKCEACNGTGNDDTDPLGICTYCDGQGECEVEYPDVDDEDDA